MLTNDEADEIKGMVSYYLKNLWDDLQIAYDEGKVSRDDVDDTMDRAANDILTGVAWILGKHSR